MKLWPGRYRHAVRAQTILLGWLGFCAAGLFIGRTSQAQAGLVGFIAAMLLWQRLISWRTLDWIEIERRHRARVFAGDPVGVDLLLKRGKGYPVQLLEVRDQFQASHDVAQYHLIPWLNQRWEVLLGYRADSDRQRGLYLIGPTELRVADSLGIFYSRRLVDCLSRLTVYPRARDVKPYQLPGPVFPPGGSMDVRQELGQGEEILGVREYVRGDSPAGVHWRTSARHRRLYVIQRNRPVQVEVAVMLDLTRRSRVGLGQESSTEMAVDAAASLLTHTYETRHRFSLAYAHQSPVAIPAGSGRDHLYLLLDRLATIQPAGETDFWAEVAPQALTRQAGSRVIFIATSSTIQLATVVNLIRELIEAGIAVDCIVIDVRQLIRIYRDQEIDLRKETMDEEAKMRELALAGARVYWLDRKHRFIEQTRLIEVTTQLPR